MRAQLAYDSRPGLCVAQGHDGSLVRFLCRRVRCWLGRSKRSHVAARARPLCEILREAHHKGSKRPKQASLESSCHAHAPARNLEGYVDLRVRLQRQAQRALPSGRSGARQRGRQMRHVYVCSSQRAGGRRLFPLLRQRALAAPRRALRLRLTLARGDRGSGGNGRPLLAPQASWHLASARSWLSLSLPPSSSFLFVLRLFFRHLFVSLLSRPFSTELSKPPKTRARAWGHRP